VNARLLLQVSIEAWICNIIKAAGKHQININNNNKNTDDEAIITTMDNEEDSVLDESEQTARPQDIALLQQRIQAWHPILDPKWVIAALFYLGAILVPVGALPCVFALMFFLHLFVLLFSLGAPARSLARLPCCLLLLLLLSVVCCRLQNRIDAGRCCGNENQIRRLLQSTKFRLQHWQ
jgi:hypothetical protein